MVIILYYPEKNSNEKLSVLMNQVDKPSFSFNRCYVFVYHIQLLKCIVHLETAIQLKTLLITLRTYIGFYYETKVYVGDMNMLERFSNWKAKARQEKNIETVKLENVPKHVAVIMDGNGRWAKKRGLPRIAGHREGMNVINKIVKQANSLGVEVLTLYAFSTENWKRPKNEVDFLMRLPERYLSVELPKLIEENVKVRLMGCKESLPEHTIAAVDNAIEKTKHNTGLVLNFALNYGSRDEIVTAIQNIAKNAALGKINPNEINDTFVAEYLMTKELRDPDLLIRTSGEIRLSNFMLWQLAYTEFWFTDVLWPDFTEQHFLEAINVYQQRARRYGGI
jgi:undecaprenyl diphosphate synthase